MISQLLSRMTVVMLLCGVLSTTSTAQAPPPAEVEAYFQRAIKKAATARQLALDPQLTRDMIADIMIFTGNFCLALREECDSLLGDQAKLQPLLQGYLSDLEGGTASIETVASRLASAEGTNITKAGWQRERVNDIGVVATNIVDGGPVFRLRSGSGLTIMGGSASKLLMHPGQWTIVVELADGSKSEYTVSVRARETSTLESARGTAQIGRIEVKSSDYCPATAEDKENEILAPFNFARAERPGGVYSHASTVTRQIGISISIDDQTGLCDQACIEGISAAFARALAIWRSGCGRCTENSLAVMQAQGNLWLDRRAAAQLREFQSTSPAYEEVDLSQISQGTSFQLGAVPALTVPIKSYVGYELVSSDAGLKSKLCTLQSPTGSDWISAAQSMVCGRHPSVEHEVKPHLVLTSAATTCGDAAVACGKPEGEVEITLKDFALVLPTQQGNVRIGAKEGALDAESVLLHEVGHWFGIPHPGAVGLKIRDIMSATFDADKTCVSAQSMALLTNATDTRFEHRARGNLGLTVDASSLTTHWKPQR